MLDRLERFVNVPMAVPMGMMPLGAAGATSGLSRFLSGWLGWVIILLAGALAVSLLLMLLRAIGRYGRKRRARPLEAGLAENVARMPQGVSKAEHRAQLDDLRRKFAEGIETFRAAGKNLYEIPWYLIVGEPGSGKTEAVRHCHVGFPPGLHRELQGAGGTINMDWWFTNHGVILDTAGRLLFEDVPAGSTSEWQECLRLLATHRPGCPINGLILVIPADSLITDTAEEIERKAGRLAGQLDVIQRALGVRFPAFILVTKCDLVNGFREFFENVDDPELQHQMLGWSNPADLDTPFDPSQVDAHLSSLVSRLEQRRYGLLLDPAPSGDPSASRIDQVDALYAFPDSLQRILPRLRQYLQMIFVGGEWSAKPLFLRGIYFTSAMREGSALDAELADALGVPVEQLPDGRVWERERAYFLRDVFTEKVFRESGLVTRAVRVVRQYRRRKAAVLAAGIMAAALLAGFTAYGWITFRSALGKRLEYFRKVAVEPEDGSRVWERDSRSGEWLFSPIVLREAETTWSSFYYQDREVVPVGSAYLTPLAFHEQLKRINEEPIHLPAVFWVAAVGQGLTDGCRKAQRILFERSVPLPLVLAVREKMAAAEPRDWSPPEETGPPVVPLEGDSTTTGSDEGRTADAAKDFPAAVATKALAQLMRLEEGDLDHADLDVEALLRYLGPKGLAAAGPDLPVLREVMAWLYRDEADGGAGRQWRPDRFAGKGLADEAIRNGVGGFIHFWSPECVRSKGDLSGLNRLAAALAAFGAEEEELLNLLTDVPDGDVAPGGRRDRYTDALEQWDERYAALAAPAKAVDERVPVLGGLTLPEAYERRVRVALDGAGRAYRLLLGDAFPGEQTPPLMPKEEAEPGDAETSAGQSPPEVVARANRRLLKAWADLQAELADRTREPWPELDGLQDRYLTPITCNGSRVRLYRHRCRIYEAAATAFPPGAGESPAPKDVQALQRYIDETRGRKEEAEGEIARLKTAAPEAFRVADAAKVAGQRCVRLKAGVRCHDALRRAVAMLPSSEEALEAAVRRRGEADPIALPEIPLTTLGEAVSPEYHPLAAAEVLALRKAVGDCLADPVHKSVPDYEHLDKAFKATASIYARYHAEYVGYWTEGLLGGLNQRGTTWQSWRTSLKERPAVSVVCPELAELGNRIQIALTGIRPCIPEDEQEGLQIAKWLAAIPTQIERLNQPARRILYGDPVGHWEALPEDPLEARTRILALTPRDLLETYVPQPEKPDLPEFADRYWCHLAHESLRLLAEAAGPEVLRKAQQFQDRFARFPLDWPDEGETLLSLQQLGQARKELSDLGVRPWAEGTIGAGEPTGHRQIDMYLDLLRAEAKLPADLRQYLERAEAVLRALPGSGVLKCDVWMLGEEDEKRLADRMSQHLGRKVWAVGKAYRTVRLFQQASEPMSDLAYDASLEKNTGSRDEIRLGAVHAPDERQKVWFRFRRYATSTRAEDFYIYSIQTSWNVLEAALRHGADDAGAGNDRVIGLLIDEDHVLGLRVQFQTDAGLPAKPEWPRR